MCGTGKRARATLTIHCLNSAGDSRGCWASIFFPRESSLPPHIPARCYDNNIDDDWNEFDLAQVYREIGPLLCEEDLEFRSEYEEMRRQITESAGVHEAQVHRRWRPCDTKIVEAWIAGRFAYRGETWNQFRERVASCRLKLSAASRHANILAFTSATPTAILTGLTLNINDGRVRQLAGALLNASYTVLRQRGEHLHLFQFNAVPHLAAPELRTHR